MISIRTQSARPALSQTLRDRLKSLGVTVGVVSAEGVFSLDDGARSVERLLAGAPQFIQAVRQQWNTLRDKPGIAVAIWPGVWLVHLPSEKRRRSGQSDHELLAALFIGRELLDSDQMHLICDTMQVDYRATIDTVDRNALVDESEAMRLASMLAWMQQDTFEVDRRCGELQSMSQQLGESYEELSLLYKLSTSMTVNQPPATFLTEACRELRQVAGLRWMALQLIDIEPRLNDLQGQIITAGPVDCDFATLRRIGHKLMNKQPAGGEPLVVDDTETLDIAHLPRLTKQLLVVWLMREGKPLGILFGGEKIDGSQISSVDSKLCNSLASSLTMFLENNMLFEDMQAMFIGTLHALTSSIDAKDSYTHGHSERVALMSRLLAASAGLDEHTVERVYLAGLVHDVGKIGVPEAVLTKPGALTKEEFGLIKMHPEIGARILQDIRQMQDLIPGVLYHHERYDGKGYPHGIGGQDIPLFGRLICLADSFDAMSSHRAYRKSMQLEQVLGEIERCAGKQFDPELAKVFVKLDFTPFFDLIRKHQSQNDDQSIDGSSPS